MKTSGFVAGIVKTKPEVLVAGLCLATQLLSATFLVGNPTSPNAATVLATSIVERGEFVVRAWPRTAKTSSGAEEPLRAYHLPGEPLLLAAGFRFLPPAFTPYLHVPVTVLFVTAVAAAGFWTGGRRLGLAAGVLAAFDPFILVHGPVWDDAFLAAALEWTVFALILKSLAAGGAGPLPPFRALALAGLIAGAAGAAALTRGSSPVLLGLVALGLVARPAFRSGRLHGWGILFGITVALSAWSARNHAVLGEFHAGSSHDGITLFESNYATARPSLLRTGIAETYALEDLAPHFQAAASMTELDANRYFKRRAFAHVMDEPVDVISTAALKGFASLTGVNLGHPMVAPRNLVALGWNLALIVAGVIGWRWWPTDRGRPEVRLLRLVGVIVATVTCLGLLVGPVGLRYRISAAPLLYLGAAAAIVSVRTGRTRTEDAAAAEPRRTAIPRA